MVSRTGLGDRIALNVIQAVGGTTPGPETCREGKTLLKVERNVVQEQRDSMSGDCTVEGPLIGDPASPRCFRRTTFLPM